MSSGKEQLGKLLPFLGELFLNGVVPEGAVVARVARTAAKHGPFAPPEAAPEAPAPPPATAASSTPCPRCDDVGEVVVRTTGGETVVTNCPKCRPRK